MSKISDQPSFPVEVSYERGELNGVQTSYTTGMQMGLTKREYFSGLAMQGLCANDIPGKQHQPKNLAREAVELADALIEQLEKSTTNA